MQKSKRVTGSKKTTIEVIFVTALLAASPIGAQDWAQWRGPARDGRLAAFAPPSSWPEALTRGWSVEVGIGYASPLVVAGRVYVFARQGEDEVASALELETGRLLWRESYAAPYSLNAAATSHGKGPKSTPVLAGGRLYTLGISGILTCRDAGTGRVIWRKDFAGEFRAPTPLYGVAMSPVVDGGNLIVHVGGHDSGALMALDAATGEARWKWAGDGPGYASPLVVDLAGVRQVVTESQDHLVGVAAADGKLLWSIPFTTSYTQNAVTPVVYKDTLIFSGLEKGVLAIRPVLRGALSPSAGRAEGESRSERGGGAPRTDRSIFSPEKVWETPGVALYMSSPVLVGDVLLGLSHRNKGQFFVLDPGTGAVLWSGEGRQGENAAVLTSGDLVLALTNDANLLIGRAGRQGFAIQKRYEVARSPTWAHPAVAGKRILVKDQSALTVWSLP